MESRQTIEEFLMSIDKYLLKYMQIYLENTDLRAAAQ
jgi:hypothetical protein